MIFLLIVIYVRVLNTDSQNSDTIGMMLIKMIIKETEKVIKETCLIAHFWKGQKEEFLLSGTLSATRST